MDHHYNWERIWLPVDSYEAKAADDFFPDAADEYSISFHLQRKLNFEKLHPKPYLFLLGEAGMGKSHQYEEFVKWTKEEVGNDANVLALDLKDYSTDFSLVNDLFKNAKMAEYRRSEKPLYIFLDSLDESLLLIRTVADIITKNFKELKEELGCQHLENIYLRIFCRTNDFPEKVFSDIKKLWKEEKEKESGRTIPSYNTFVLARLTEENVKEAARKELDISGDDFLQLVYDRDAVQFANKPITLFMLINYFNQNKELPPTKSVFYNTGCKHLIEEWNLPERERRGTGNTHSTEEKFDLAKQIAAQLVFSNRTAITYRELSERSDDILCILDIFSDSSNSFVDNNSLLKELLQSALFRKTDEDTYNFTHKTYLEYLAAQYLLDLNVSVDKIIQLISSFDNTIQPQVEDVVPWLIREDSDIRNPIIDFVMQNDPITLLKSDELNDETKEKLTDKILQMFGSEETEPDFFYRDIYKNINHKNLDKQLDSYLNNKDLQYPIFREIMYIIEVCKIETFRDFLCSIVLNHEKDVNTRGFALRALFPIANDEVFDKLKCLLQDELFYVLDRDLQYLLINLFFPRFIGIKEFFELISNPADYKFLRDLFLDEYKISATIFKELDANPQDYAIALNWFMNISEWLIAIKQFNDNSKPDTLDDIDIHDLEEFAIKIISRSGRFLNTAEVRKAFAELFFIEQHSFLYDLNEVIESSSQENRQQLLLIILDKLTDKPENQIDEILFRLPINVKEDLQLLIDFYNGESNEKKRKVLLLVIGKHFSYLNASESLIELIESTINSDAEFGTYFKPIFDESKELSKKHLSKNQQNKIQSITKREKITREIDNQIEVLLNEYEKGNNSNYWRLDQLLSSEYEKNRRYFDNLDLKHYRVFNSLSENMRRMVFDYAEKFLSEYQHPLRDEIKNNITDDMRAGVRALYSIWVNDRSRFKIFSNDLLINWSWAIIPSLAYSGEKEKEFEFLKQFEKIQYNHLIDGLKFLIKLDIEKAFFLLNQRSYQTEIYLTNEVLDLIFSKRDELKAKKDTPARYFYKKKHYSSSFISMLQILNSLNYHNLYDYCMSLVENSNLESDNYEYHSVYAGKILLDYEDGRYWDFMWEKIRKYPEYGEAVSYQLEHRFEMNHKFPKNLNIGELTEYYEWLLERFPIDTDIDRTGVSSYTPTKRDDMQDFRDKLLFVIAKRGKDESVNTLNELKQKYPEVNKINYALKEAILHQRKNNWEPLSPVEFLVFVKNEEKRRIRSNKDLLEVVIESLQRFEVFIHDENPIVNALWNEGDKIRPKEENFLSDIVAKHFLQDLKNRGIIINREVQIKRGKGEAKGEIPDIYVSAVSHNDNKNHTVVIETKGCFHPNLKTAMKNQLKDKYMNKENLDTGLYLVGWYWCTSWDKNHDGYKKTRAFRNQLKRKDLEGAKDDFNKQAEELSDDTHTIKSFVLDCRIK